MMETFDVVLTKSYVIRMSAKDSETAERLAELFTGDINDLSTPEMRDKFKFEIQKIDCKFNEAISSETVTL